MSIWAPFASRDYRLHQLARFVGTIGLSIQSVAVGWQVYDLTHEPLYLGYVGLVQFVPLLFFSLVGGQLADRFDRKRLLALCYGAWALGAVGLGWLSSQPKLDVLHIFPVVALLGVARAFAGPASQALMPNLVPKTDFARAVTWGANIWQAAVVMGPPLGGFLYVFGASVTYFIAAGCLFVSALLIALIQSRGGTLETRRFSFVHLAAGIEYVWAHKLLLGAISLDLFAVLLGGAVALLPAMAQDVLHAGPDALGVLRAAPAVGAMFVATALVLRPVNRRAGHWLLCSVAIFGIATVVFGASKSIGLSVCALAVAGGADMVSVSIRQALVQLATPDSMRGRVSSVSQVFISASNELGEFESGVVAHWIGTVPAIIFGGCGTVLVVGLWSVLFPRLRRVDRLDDELGSA